MTVKEEKSALRKKIKDILKNMTLEERKNQSDAVCKKILSSSEYLNADSVLSYMAMDEELNLNCVNENCLKSMEKKLFLPHIALADGLMFFYEINKKLRLESQCKKNKWNILEPQENEENKFNVKKMNAKNILLLVPGLAFTKEKKRLGRGKGFYDRFYEKLKSECLKNNCTLITAAVCFREQLVKDIPCEENDFLTDRIYFESFE